MCLGYKKHYKPYQTKPYQTLVAHALPLWTSTVPRIICIIKALSPGLYGLEWLFTLFFFIVLSTIYSQVRGLQKILRPCGIKHLLTSESEMYLVKTGYLWSARRAG